MKRLVKAILIAICIMIAIPISGELLELDQQLKTIVLIISGITIIILVASVYILIGVIYKVRYNEEKQQYERYDLDE